MPATITPSTRDEIVRTINELIEPNRPHGTPNYVFCAVSSDSTDPADPKAALKPAFWTSAGPRDVRRRQSSEDSRGPPDLDTRIPLHSCTKLVTSLGVLALLDDPRGKAAGFVSIDQRVDVWLPELGRGRKKVLKGWVDGEEPVWEEIEEGRDITVRMLLTHTSGLSNQLNRLGAKWVKNIGEECDNDSLERYFMDLPLFFQPGTRYQYGVNTDFLGLLIERITALPLSKYLQERFFDPLGMHNTGWYPSALWDRAQHSTRETRHPTTIADSAVGMRAHFAGRRGDGLAGVISAPVRVYERGDSALVSAESETPAERTPGCEMGGHGLWSTTGDYGRLLSWLLRLYQATFSSRVLDYNDDPDDDNKEQETCRFLSPTVARLVFTPCHPPEADMTPLLRQALYFHPGCEDEPGLKNFGGHSCVGPLVVGGEGPSGEPVGTMWWVGKCRIMWTLVPSCDLGVFMGTYMTPPYVPYEMRRLKDILFKGVRVRL
ncbi:unnamed protein product [Tilletia controversa]|nr:unnamed protein product [Tilletia controversa]